MRPFMTSFRAPDARPLREDEGTYPHTQNMTPFLHPSGRADALPARPQEPDKEAKPSQDERAPLTPTMAQYEALHSAYERLNRELFQGTLRPVVFTLQRSSKYSGYYSHNRMASRSDPDREASEIAINPDAIAGRPDYFVLRVIAHEMCHAWQYHYGKPGRRGYHNQQFADKMEEIGLIASDTGRPGGKRLGQRMSEYIVTDGPFDRLARAMTQGQDPWRLDWDDAVSRENLQHIQPPIAVPGKDVHIVVNDHGDPKLVLSEPGAPPPPPPPADAVEPQPDDTADGASAENAIPEALHSLLPEAETPEQDIFVVYIDDQPVRLARNVPRRKKKVYRHKYQCPQCAMTVWGKPGIAALCAEHLVPLELVGSC